MRPVIIAALSALSALSAVASADSLPLAKRWMMDADGGVHHERVIRVGVRADAQPFAYRSSTHEGDSVLGGYGGYMIEICRRVLRDVKARGVFKDYSVLAVEVEASDRFTALHEGEVDMLCGPDSITLDRLADLNASYPLFLSGVSFASASTDRFPRKKYCEGVVGLLPNTTAMTQGLTQIARSNRLARFDDPLDAYLAKRAAGPATTSESAEADALEAIGSGTVKRFRSSLISRIEQVADGTLEESAEVSSTSRENDVVTSSSVVTGECPTGYENGPVIYYESHDEGIKAFCDGEILYYVGDIDIISGKLRDRKNCGFVMHQETLTKEAYGIYFRKPKRRGGANGAFDDGAFYAEFSNVLLTKMQASINILDYEFEREFKGRTPSADLRRFFDGFKYANHF